MWRIRILNEVYKVIDCSDIIAFILDSRNPLFTKCDNIEKYLEKNYPTKNIIYILTKSDLVPSISIGLIGFPNVGKSSIINSLRTKNICNVAPIPGETRV
ncbi:nucleolar GTP-binding protein 2-like [Alosa alosa]|uniref:nucleolar GTP-binding protein 2-like n=1 Tax=Alosa alosa TaxID=278164 RepID=UPI0020154CE7|nr:nucleolar GTP-binding protein 2-like [Alosa alosa]